HKKAFERSHLPGALSIPLSEIQKFFSRLPHDKPIIVYCQNSACEMSERAARKLWKLGFDGVLKLEEGIDEWKSKNLPLEKGLGIEEKTHIHKLKKYLPEEVRTVSSDKVVSFLESLSPRFDFDYLGYEVKSVKEIGKIYLMINPDPRNLEQVKPESLLISHHKISTHQNPIFEKMLQRAEKKKVNVYNFHLAWDIMDVGIGDSFLHHLGFDENEYEKVDLTYRGERIPDLGRIVKTKISLEELLERLEDLNVSPSMLVNPQCKEGIVGYIPGGGFLDEMIFEMRKYGVDILVSSDSIFVTEIVGRELGMTLVEIDHYTSEKYGLYNMQNLLIERFPKLAIQVVEDVERVSCTCCGELLSLR
ncbi:MAG: Nif3-like dinuclear metal center hexameric protein, partial [Candidatus Methanofastidiosia archaeon]